MRKIDKIFSGYPDKVIILAAKEVLRKMKTSEIKSKSFNMDFFTQEHKCGTVHCLGGFMSLELGLDPNGPPNGPIKVSHLLDARLHNLFFPSDIQPYSAQKSKGIKALENFLDGKLNPWKGVK